MKEEEEEEDRVGERSRGTKMMKWRKRKQKKEVVDDDG